MESIKLYFDYYGEKTIIISNRKENMKDIFKKYKLEIKIENIDTFFLYNGNIINEELKLGEINNKDNEINILVYNVDNDDNEDYIKQSKYIICFKCKELCKINFNDYKITLNNCIN